MHAACRAVQWTYKTIDDNIYGFELLSAVEHLPEYHRPSDGRTQSSLAARSGTLHFLLADVGQSLLPEGDGNKNYAVATSSRWQHQWLLDEGQPPALLPWMNEQGGINN